MADGVSATDAFNVGRMFSAPLAPYAQTGTNQVNLASVSSGVAALTGLSFLSSPNPIIQTVDPNNLTITNVAIAPHVFTGSVQMTFTTDSNGKAWENFSATGFGPNAALNQVMGPILFYSFGILTSMFSSPPSTNNYPSSSMRAN
ncbi:hypothetical protein AAKU58_004439 [Oxalobacteraceae bacterium GrIS 1.18]